MRAADLRSWPTSSGGGLSLDRTRLETIARIGIFLGLGILAAVAAVWSPLALLVGVAVVGLAWLVAWRDRPLRIFHQALIALLVGYAILGRGLAHVGLPPLYIGEVVLALGMIGTIFSAPKLRGGPIRLLIVAFMAWGALQTIPYIASDGINAFRDAVTWGYALFALMISLTITGKLFDGILRIYRAIIPIYCLWVPFTLIFGRLSPGEGESLVNPKPGDMGVLLAGIAAFALLGLYSAAPKPRIPEPVMWLVWLPAAATVAIFNRGGMVAMVATGAVILFLRLPQRWLPPIFFTLLIAITLIWVNPEVEIGQGRTISVGQFAENITSLVTETNSAALEGTKEFRLNWWSKIIDYTVFGPYFWTGKGFGINLADDDGFQVYADHSLRAPHNGHIEILARAGVPGLVLWVALNAAIAFGLLWAASRARALGRTRWVAIDGWLFVAWLAATFNASFDPSLQGPHGGIWFWSMVGLAIVAIEASTEPEAAPDEAEDEPLPEPDPAPSATPPLLRPV